MSANGFTEDDQVRIAEEVQARAGGKRTGLGFSLGEAQSDEGATQYSRSRTSLFSSNYSRETHGESLFSCKSDPKDTTKGEFPWDDGQRGKCGPAHVRNEVRPSQPRDSQEQVQPKEREFPMIRDRDIERCITEREKSERKERRRSRSKSEDRKRSRSRWRSMESEREERNRQDGKYRERDRDRRRDSSRDRRKERGRGRKIHDCREDRYRDLKYVPGDKSHNEKHDMWAESNSRKEPQVLTAEQAKAAVKRKLKAATEEDESLRIGSKATVGGGVGWERSEMSGAAEFFRRDEIAAKGGVASVAQEYDARIAQIHAVEDEETTCLGDALGRQMVDKDGSKLAGTIESRTTKHNEAIFAPTDLFSGSDGPPVSTTTASSTVGSEVSGGATGAAFTSPSVVGAAIRTRLALKGKSYVPKTASRSQDKSRVGSAVKNESLSQAKDQEAGTLFKALKVGDSVEARYTADGKWYPATIIQAIHGGYEIARYKVRYVDYGNEETLPWKMIKQLNAATSIPLEVKPSDATEICASEVGVPSRSSAVSLGVSDSDESPSLATGLVLPSLGVEEPQPPSKDLAESPEQRDETRTDVVNPNILTSSRGRGMSWKQKIQAKKSGSSVGLESESRGISLLPTEMSLVLGSKEPEQVSDGRGCLNNTQWRAKVAFGMKGNSRA